MNSASRSVNTRAPATAPIDEKITRYRMPIVVRLKYGEELAGMRLFEDGLSFHSPAPFPLGRIVELILCGGSILVDAQIVTCEPISDGVGGFVIRARYHETSPEMQELIAAEIRRALPTEEAGAPA